MSRLSLNIGTVAGDGTGDPARTGGNKINLNFAELYAFLGGDTLTQTAGSVLLGNGTGALSSFASTAGRLVIGNGSSGLTDDANLTWHATNGLTVNKQLSCPGPTATDQRFGVGTVIYVGGGHNTVIGANATIGTSGGASAGANSNTVVGADAFTGDFSYFNTIVGQGGNTGRSSCTFTGQSITSDADSIAAFGGTLTASLGGAASVGATGMFGTSLTLSHKGSTLMGHGFTSLNNYETACGWAYSEAGTGSSFLLYGATGAFQGRPMSRQVNTWVDSTDATRKARAVLSTYDTAEREYMRADSTGAAAVNVAFLSGGSLITQGAALATTATDGFLYIPTSAGAPTGTPTAQTGTVALQYDTTNNNLYAYNGAWKKVAMT